ncbi:hypothetical protein AGMMS49928_22930 [Spirochaetia bacterium]|nr:hypothetical protein AGMMS49928_22930 [Spirochaetia bacterium]
MDYIEITWEKTAGAASYEIYRSENPDGTSASKLASVYGNLDTWRNTVSVNQQGIDFYYKVAAVNDRGNKSLETRPAYGYARVAGAPDTPSWVRLAANSGKGNSTNEIKIEWENVADAEYYAVYRYSSLDSSLTRLTPAIRIGFYENKRRASARRRIGEQ